jgi:cytochrome P450
MRVQSKLREELLQVDTDNPTMDQLNALPYLDMVVRETLRVHAPVPSTIRVAVQDDILPLNDPVTDLKGRVHDFIP